VIDDVNLVCSDVRRPRRPRTPPRIVRHKGTIENGVIFLERGAWIRTVSTDGDCLADLYDPRFICRLEIGDGAILSGADGISLCTVVVTAILADWGRKFGTTKATFAGACFVLPCTGLRT
jgi:hypothetical protein